MCKECAQDRELHIKLEEERDVETFIDYVEDYFQLTPSDENKRARELYEDFKKQTYNRQKILIRIQSACISLSTAMVWIPPLISSGIVKNKTNASATIIFLFIFRRKLNIILVAPATLHLNGTLLTFSEYSGCT